MSRIVTFRGILLVIILMIGSGCARNYDVDPAGEEGPAGPDGENAEPGLDSERQTPFLSSIDGVELLHLRYTREPDVHQLDGERWAIITNRGIYVWNSSVNRVEQKVDSWSIGPRRVLWAPPSGDGVLLRGEDEVWIDLVNGASVEVRNADPDGFQKMTDRGFITTGQIGEEYTITEHLVVDGVLRFEQIDTVSDVRYGTLRRFRNVYTYRDDRWDVVVQHLDDDATPVTVVENASVQKTFADGRYLYLESSTPTLVDTQTGERVDFPPDWRWNTLADQGSEHAWTILSQGSYGRAFWTVGQEPVEVPYEDGLRFFGNVGAGDELGWLYAHYENRIEMVIYAFDSGQFWTVDITDVGFHEEPALTLDEAGEPVVVWPARVVERSETATYWRPAIDAVQPLPGTSSQTRKFWPTRDPSRFVGVDFNNRFVVADLERERLIEAGPSSPCGRNAVASDGRFIGTSIGRDFSIFDVDTATSKVIGRNVDFFGAGCRESFTRGMTRGLFLSAFDGKIGDLSYWDGDSAVKVLGNVPGADARLDRLSGTWSIVGRADELRYLAEFESESRSLTVIGEATASNPEKAWDRAGRNVVFLDTEKVNVPSIELQATIHLYRPMLDESPTGLVSGPFAAVWMLGDDVLAQNVGDVRSTVIITDDGPIDPGAIEDELWVESEDDEVLRDGPGKQ